MLLIFLFCLILIIIITRALFGYQWASRKTIRPEQLKTGDLILFAGSYSRYTPNLFGIEHTHCAMIYRDSDGLKILELTSSGDWPECQSHPILHDFYKRVNDYTGYATIKRCRKTINNADILKAAEKYKNIEFDTNYTQHFLEQAIVGKRTPRKKWCCSEYIYMILCSIGMYKYNKKDFHDSFRKLSDDVNNFTDNYQLKLN